MASWFQNVFKAFPYPTLMKKVVIILVLFFVISWNWDAHKGFVESSFDQFPKDLKDKLSLPLIQDGAIVPDRDFQDFINHSYPNSIKAINYWFNISKTAYLAGDYKITSRAIGIASHYLSDSFAAPHSVSGESYEKHKLYEDQAGSSFNVKCINLNLESYVSERVKDKPKEWKEWLRDENSKIPEKSAEEAADVVYSSILNLFDVKCENKIDKENTRNYWSYLIIILVLIIIVYYFRKYF